MKDIMRASIEEKRSTIFQSSADEVKSRLEIMMTRQGKLLQDKLNVTMQGFRHDYTTVFGTLEARSIEAGHPDPMFHKEVKKIFDEYEIIFRKLAEDPKGRDGTGDTVAGVTDTAVQEDLDDGMEVDDLQSDTLTVNHCTIPEGQSPTDEMRIEGSAAASTSSIERQVTGEVRPKKEQE